MRSGATGSPRATERGCGAEPLPKKKMIPIRTCGGIGTTCREPDVRPEALLFGRPLPCRAARTGGLDYVDHADLDAFRRNVASEIELVALAVSSKG